MTYCYLDIETIPAQTEALRAHIAGTVKPPAAMKKAETISAWEKEQKPTAIDDAVAKTSFNGAYGQICCVGVAFDDEPAQSVSWPLHHKDEAEALRYLASFLSTTNRAPVVVGHNVANFDIRFLWQRAMVLGIRMPVWLPRNPKPWGNDIFDTMTAFAGQRDTISLDNLAFALGVGGKGDIDGSMVAQMFADGRHEEIAAYCRADVELTRKVHQKMKIAFGEAA